MSGKSEPFELDSLPLFQGFSSSLVADLSAGGSARIHKHREVLYHAGEVAESFALVLSGAYKLVRPTPRGDDLIVYFATPGDVIGALVMSQDGAGYPVTATAMGPSRSFVIPRSTFQRVWSSQAKIQQRLNAFLYTRMSRVQDERALARAPLEQRIATLLLHLLDRSGGSDGRILPIPLTRQEIADSLGAAVESVIRIMSDWSQRGLIRTTDRQIEIQRFDQIARMIKDP